MRRHVDDVPAQWEKGGYMPNSSKICVICGKDCAGQPRMKDAQERYFHKKCVALELERKAQQGPPATVNPDLSQETGIEIDPADMMNEITYEAMHSEESHRTCTSCGLPLTAHSVICINCGFDTHSGFALEENVGNKKPRHARGSFADNASELLCSNFIVGLAVFICALAIILLVLTISG